MQFLRDPGEKDRCKDYAISASPLCTLHYKKDTRTVLFYDVYRLLINYQQIRLKHTCIKYNKKGIPS